MSTEDPTRKVETHEKGDDKLGEIVELMRPSYQVIDTGVLNDKHRETLYNFEFGNFNGESLSLVRFEKGALRPPHIHDTSAAKFYFIEGNGFVILNGEKIPYAKGTYVEVPAGAPHGFEVTEDTLMFSIQDNGGIIKEDKSIDFRYE